MNSKLLSEQITHGVALGRIEEAAVKRLLRLMAELDRELAQKISELVAKLKGRFSGPSLRKASRLLQLEKAINELARDIRGLNRRTYSRMADALLKGKDGILAGLVKQELGIQHKILGDLLEGSVGIVKPSYESILSVVDSKPFGGLRFHDWMRDLSATRQKKIVTEIQKGVLADESIPQIIQRVRGKGKQGVGGVIKLSRRDAETWVRSAVQHAAGEARDALFGSNKDLVKAEIWVSTLDDRTCLEWCVPRDGKRYTPVEHKPIGHKIPWKDGPGRIHPRCRCGSSVQLVSWKDLGIDGEDLPPELRRSMDGEVPAELSFAEWAEDQSLERLATILGKKRALLVKRGKLAVKDLWDLRGNPFTLEELMARERKAFKLAGLE